MVRLPQPGQDDGVWGDVLNDFLLVTHTPAGAIKNSSVVEAQLATDVRVKLNATGVPGPKGDAGAPGVDGASAYELAVAAGFVGSQTAWLTSLKGEKGDTGDTGAGGSGGSVSWTAVTDKPAVFAPDTHAHAITDITSLQAALDTKVTALDGSYRVYINDHEGKPSFVIYSASSTSQYSIMQRDADGRSVVEAPATDLQVANKAYVDNHIQPASTMHVAYAGAAWPARPTDRADVLVFWVGGTVAPSGALAHDIWYEEIA